MEDTAGVRQVACAAGLNTAGWDGLVAAEDFFQSARWLAVQERNGGTRLDFLVRQRAGRPVAGLVAAWADQTVPWLLARPDTLLAHAREARLAGAEECAAALAGGAGDLAGALLPALVCGGRHLGRTRVLTAPAATRSDMDELVTRAESLAVERGAATVCFPHVDVRDSELTALLADRGYHWHTCEYYSWLPVPPGGFEEYLGGMSQHRRRRVRLERRTLAAAGVEVHVEPLTNAMTPRLGELDANLLAKYGNPADATYSAGLLAWIGEVMGEDALVSLATKDGAVIGFGLVLRSRVRGGEQWFGHRAGFDYAAKGALPLYYEVLYYRVLEAAAQAGASVLHAGIGSTEAKVARGCQTSEQRSYLRRMPYAATVEAAGPGSKAEATQ
jgi:uncharacterized protein